MKSSNPWRFRLRLQIIDGKRRLIIDSHLGGMGVCIRIYKKDYEFLKHAGVLKQRPVHLGLKK